MILKSFASEAVFAAVREALCAQSEMVFDSSAFEASLEVTETFVLVESKGVLTIPLKDMFMVYMYESSRVEVFPAYPGAEAKSSPLLRLYV